MPVLCPLCGHLAPDLLAQPNLGRSYCDPHDPEITRLLHHWLAAPED